MKWVIVSREKPSRPWEFVTYFSGTRRDADESARQTEEQERGVCKHPKAEVKALTELQWESKAGRTRKRKQRKKAKPKEEGGYFLGVRI